MDSTSCCNVFQSISQRQMHHSSMKVWKDHRSKILWFTSRNCWRVLFGSSRISFFFMTVFVHVRAMVRRQISLHGAWACGQVATERGLRGETLAWSYNNHAQCTTVQHSNHAHDPARRSVRVLYNVDMVIVAISTYFGTDHSSVMWSDLSRVGSNVERMRSWAGKKRARLKFLDTELCDSRQVQNARIFLQPGFFALSDARTRKEIVSFRLALLKVYGY